MAWPVCVVPACLSALFVGTVMSPQHRRLSLRGFFPAVCAWPGSNRMFGLRAAGLMFVCWAIGFDEVLFFGSVFDGVRRR